MLPIRKLHPCCLKSLFDHCQRGSALFAFPGLKQADSRDAHPCGIGKLLLIPIN
jgi:hypothetical protein